MASGILLDSSVIIPHLRGRLDLSALAPQDEVLFISLTVLGELYKGVFKSDRPAESRAKLESFFTSVSVMNPDVATAIQYAQIAADLERRGAVIPENDIWIAALAMECGMPLATRDAHFQKVAGLRVLQW